MTCSVVKHIHEKVLNINYCSVVSHFHEQIRNVCVAAKIYYYILIYSLAIVYIICRIETTAQQF